MKTPIKRPIELKYGYLYQLKDGRKVVYIGEEYDNKPVFIKLGYSTKNRYLYFPHWKRQICKRLRKTTIISINGQFYYA